MCSTPCMPTAPSRWSTIWEKYLRLKNLHLPPAEKLTLDWVRSNTAIVHYYGRNKPWKEHYRGSLGIFYHEWEQQLQQLTGKN